VVVSDSPWPFRDKGSRIAPNQRRKRLGRKGYRTLTVDQIAALPVGQIVAPDALLFLWTTSTHLLDGSASRVCRAWGFEPKATIAWVKTGGMDLLAWLLEQAERFGWNPWVVKRAARYLPDVRKLQIGMGHYVRGAHELVLLGRRGRAKVVDRGVPSVFYAPRRGHSQKPAEFRDLVDRLTGGKPTLELFARGPVKRTEAKSWTFWGDEVPTDLSTGLSTTGAVRKVR